MVLLPLPSGFFPLAMSIKQTVQTRPSGRHVALIASLLSLYLKINSSPIEQLIVYEETHGSINFIYHSRFNSAVWLVKCYQAEAGYQHCRSDFDRTFLMLVRFWAEVPGLHQQRFEKEKNPPFC